MNPIKVISLAALFSLSVSNSVLATPINVQTAESSSTSAAQSSVNVGITNKTTNSSNSAATGGNSSSISTGGSATGGNASTGSSSAQLSGITMSPSVSLREASDFPALPVAPTSYNSFGGGVSCAAATVYGNAFVRETGYSATEFGAVVGFSTPVSKKEDDRNCSKLGKLQRQRQELELKRLEVQAKLEALRLKYVQRELELLEAQ